MPDKLPPYNGEAEEAVIGAILIENRALLDISLILGVGDFYREHNAWVYDACLALYARSEAINQITLAHELEQRGNLAEVGGPTYLHHCVAQVPTSLHGTYYAGIVKRTADMRRLIQAGGKIAQLGYDGEDADKALAAAESILLNLRSGKSSRGLVPLSEIAASYLAEMAQEETAEEPVERVRVPTGIGDLDRLLGGLHPTDLVILAARPGMGKTSLLINIAEHAALQAKLNVALFSLEMSREQLLERLIASKAWLDSQKLRHWQTLSENERAQVKQTATELGQYPIWIDDAANLTVSEIRSKARILAGQQGLGLIMVDYLQLLDGDGRRRDNRVVELGDISKGLKALAKELRVPVLAAAQLSRAVEHRPSRKPMLSDLRDSGNLEQDADVVMFIYSEDQEGNARILDVAKHRQGPKGSVNLRFVAERTHFYGMDEREERPEGARRWWVEPF